MAQDQTMAALVLALADVDRPGILTAERTWTHAEAISEAATRGAWLNDRRNPGHFHVAVMLDNTVDYLLWLEAAALVGATVVGANPTHRGDELARDLSHTQCQLLVTSTAYLPLVNGHDLGPALGIATEDSDRVLVVDTEAGSHKLAPFATATAGEVVDHDVSPQTLGYLLFTSGTSGAPKAVRCTQGRLAGISDIVRQMTPLGVDDVVYAAMPLFHSKALRAGWGPSLAGQSAVALPAAGRFSASGFLKDVRAHGVTFFNYVGKPLSYILATPEQADDADTTLRACFGNEATVDDIDRFATRFGCTVNDAYGSSEGGATVTRTADTPKGALGRAPFEGTVVLDPETQEECPPARFDDAGRLLNATECIGELVSKTGGSSFEGYWANDEAMEARLRNGWYWTGDLAYRDDEGFFYFAGRDHDWLRVDGENFAAAPIERILGRHPDVMLAAVYAVPDELVGVQVMVALELVEGAQPFDPTAFRSFLEAQEDLGTKWAPKFIRLTHDLPKTATSKVVKKSLRAERWKSADTIWWRSGSVLDYEILQEKDIRRLDDAVSDRVL